MFIRHGRNRVRAVWGALLSAGLAGGLGGSAAGATSPPSTSSLATAPRAEPIVVVVDTFTVRSEGAVQKSALMQAPNLLRLDELTDGYSVIYQADTEHYTGLENRNDTWWEFSWPEVEAAVKNSQRYDARLKELTINGLNNYAETNVDAGVSTSVAPGATDAIGYVWTQLAEHKRIAGLDCVRWKGETLSGDNVDLWCTTALLPGLSSALADLRTINEPMALVPVRTILPPLVFIVFDAMAKGGNTPLQIDWGSGPEKNSFLFTGEKSLAPKKGLFGVPSYYLKTTLVTMDGMLPPPGK